MKPDRFRAALASIGAPRILVIGDIILDHYVEGAVERISPEAPIPILRVTKEEYKLGGAGNVAANLAALGAQTTLMGRIGADDKAATLRAILERHAINASYLTVDPSCPTTLKSRMLAGPQQILRVDREDLRPLEELEVIEAQVEDCLAAIDLVIISDYGKGVMTTAVTQMVIRLARARGIKVIVDPKGREYAKYRGATTLTPNLLEAQLASGAGLGSAGEMDQVGARMVAELDLEALIITLGKGGMFLIKRDGATHRVRSRPLQVFDVTGAGDSSIAMFGLAVAAQVPFETALSLANTAGGIAVGRVGAAIITREDLLDSLHWSSASTSGSISRLSTLLETLSNDGVSPADLAVIVGDFSELDASALELARRCGEEGRAVVALLTRSEGVKVAEEVKSIDHSMVSRDPAADVARLQPGTIAFHKVPGELQDQVLASSNARKLD